MKLPTHGLVVLCGPAGSGKSTFASRHFAPTQIVSSDRLRGMVSDDETDQEASAAAFFLLRAIVRFRMQRHLLTIVDSTALLRKSRQELLRLARERNAESMLVLFEVDVETCIARNAVRPHPVPEDVLRGQHRLFERAVASISTEGFGRVLRLRPGDSFAQEGRP